jgi:hypothetical protein
LIGLSIEKLQQRYDTTTKSPYLDIISKNRHFLTCFLTMRKNNIFSCVFLLTEKYLSPLAMNENNIENKPRSLSLNLQSLNETNVP